MSKAQGKLITVKFTQSINELALALPKYKYFRWEIDTSWGNYMYLYGIELLIDGSYILPTGIATASGQYLSTYGPEKAFDGSTSTYWRTNIVPCWIQIELTEPVTIEGFRWNTQTTSSRPRGFKLMASTNGIKWVELYNGESLDVSYWKNFSWVVYQQSGNEEAFKVTGKEYKWVDGPDNNGPILDREYKIGKVENYGIVPIWRLGDSVDLDTLDLLEIIDTGAIQIPSDTSASLSVNAEAGDIVLATVSLRSSSTVPTGWTEIYRSAVGGNNQYLVLATKEITSDGPVTYTATQSSSGRIMINLVAVRNVRVAHAPEFTVVGDFTGAVSVPNKQVGEKLIWGMSANIWTSTGYNSWQTSPDDLQLVDFISPDPPPRQANFIDLGEGEATDRTFIPGITGETSLFISAVKLLEGFDSYKVEEISPIEITGQYRVRWQEDKPTGTDITIECTTGTEQGGWIGVSNGDVITSDTNLWFRVTLETTDTSVTPTLQDLWIEEPEAPQDKIRMVLGDYSRFPSVLGDITVEYDASLGNLSGIGGAVQSFTETFTPTGLVAEPNPGHTHTLSVAPSLEVDLLPVEYIDRFTTDTITAAPVELTVELIHISIINP